MHFHSSFPTHFPPKSSHFTCPHFSPLTRGAFNKTGTLPARLHGGRFFPLCPSLPSAPPMSLLTLITLFFPYFLRLGVLKRALDAICAGDTRRFPQHVFSVIRDTVLRCRIDTVAVLRL